MKKNKHILHNDLRGSNQPFKVPEGYFESFADRMMQRIDEEESSKNKGRGIIRYLRPVLAMAASFAIIFLMVYVPVRIFSPNETVLQAEQYHNGFSEIISFYMINDHAIVQAFEKDDTYDYEDEFIESFLLASMSEYDLIHLNN
jgi:hypothetical protein